MFIEREHLFAFVAGKELLGEWIEMFVGEVLMQSDEFDGAKSTDGTMVQMVRVFFFDYVTATLILGF
jgi:hypothetical protein